MRLLRDLPPDVGIIGTTATANTRVIEDVTEILGADLHVLRGPLTRDSLNLYTFPTALSAAERLALLAEHEADTRFRVKTALRYPLLEVIAAAGRLVRLPSEESLDRQKAAAMQKFALAGPSPKEYQLRRNALFQRFKTSH